MPYYTAKVGDEVFIKYTRQGVILAVPVQGIVSKVSDTFVSVVVPGQSTIHRALHRHIEEVGFHERKYIRRLY